MSKKNLKILKQIENFEKNRKFWGKIKMLKILKTKIENVKNKIKCFGKKKKKKGY